MMRPIERHVQFFDGGPELAILGNVVMRGVVVVADLREAVHQSSDESEVSYGPGEFLGCRLGILSRQCRERSESIRVPCHVLGQFVIRPPGKFDRAVRVRSRLHGRRIQGENREVDSALVHRL